MLSVRNIVGLIFIIILTVLSYTATAYTTLMFMGIGMGSFFAWFLFIYYFRIFAEEVDLYELSRAWHKYKKCHIFMFLNLLGLIVTWSCYVYNPLVIIIIGSVFSLNFILCAIYLMTRYYASKNQSEASLDLDSIIISYPIVDYWQMVDESSDIDGYFTIGHDYEILAMKEPCCICFENYEWGDESVAIRTNCKHEFHKACLKEWCLTRDGDYSCPMCRQPIFK
eukprot:NODE_127_length_17034_cov_0.369590.p9 type:complete len:224 gc:universal NODE_127_length_17034_cov_0.369590:12989-12318(-)